MGAITTASIFVQARGRWVVVSCELTAENRRMVYVLKGFAHGFVTRKDHSEVFYQMSDSITRSRQQGSLERSSLRHVGRSACDSRT